MKFKLSKIYLSVVAFISSGMPAANCQEAESPLHQVWSFDDCLRWACENTTDKREALLSILQAEQDVSSAKDKWLPSVGFSTTHNYSNYPVPADGMRSNSYTSNYGVNASWTLWEGNARKYHLESAKLMLQQQQLAAEDVDKAMTLAVLQSYIDILYAKDAAEIARQNLEVSREQTQRAKRLMESGRISRVDYAQIESQEAQDSYNLVQAENAENNAHFALKNLLQLGLGYELKIVDSTFPDINVMSPLPEKKDVYESALAWFPSLRSNALNREIYANDVKEAKADYLPTIDLTGGIGTGYSSGGDNWGYQMGHNFGPKVGVSVNVPIFDGNATKRAVAKARLNELEYELKEKNLVSDLAQTIDQIYIEASNAKAKYQAGLVQLESTSLTNDLTSRQFELGLVNPLELLTARNNYLNARLELLQSKYMAILAEKTITYYASRQIAMP